jgi:hypothetical protein
MQAKGLLAEYQPKHFSARAVYRERKKYCERIDANMLAVPPTGSYKASSIPLMLLNLIHTLKTYSCITTDCNLLFVLAVNDIAQYIVLNNNIGGIYFYMPVLLQNLATFLLVDSAI